MTGFLSWELKKCTNPSCLRAVKAYVLYCCSPCADAAAGHFEVHAHSEGCDARAAERGDYGRR